MVLALIDAQARFALVYGTVLVLPLVVDTLVVCGRAELSGEKMAAHLCLLSFLVHGCAAVVSSPWSLVLIS